MSEHAPQSDADLTPSSAAAGSPLFRADESGDDAGSGGWFTLSRKPEEKLERTGRDPDPRFTFANERTFLAWNRTALALIAAGLAAAQFLHFNLHGLRLIIAVPLIVLGAMLSITGYLHWQENERAMRLRQPIRYSWMPRVLTVGIALIALCGGILAVVDRLVH